MRSLLETPFSLSKREAHACSSCFVSATDQSGAFGFGLGFSFPFDDDFPFEESCCAVGIVGAQNFTC